MNESKSHDGGLTTRGRALILIFGFLGWMFAGTQMSITSVAMRSAATDLLGAEGAGSIDEWTPWLICAFLFGAAFGGLLFGWIGDRFGRSKGLALAVCWFSLFSGLTYFVQNEWQLLLLRFITCLGVGGTWPNGVSLVAEAWSRISRPMLAGVMGMAANVGIALMAKIAGHYKVTPEDWRWILVLGAAPIVIGVLAFFALPESPLWIKRRAEREDEDAGEGGAEKGSAAKRTGGVQEIFSPPILQVTLVGIVLGSVPLIGGWGATGWAIQWADQFGSNLEVADHTIKADTQFYRAVGGMAGSVLGGLVAAWVGRRLSFFLMSVFSLALSQYLFRALQPDDGQFLWIVGALGFWSTMFFGWLPLCLPELFPTRVRSTGSGVSFNFGRFLAAGTVFLTGYFAEWFDKDYSRIGAVTSFVFLVGMAVIWFAPDTKNTNLEE